MVISTLLSITAISFLGIFVMISYRLLEIKKGRVIVSDISEIKFLSRRVTRIVCRIVLKLEYESIRITKIGIQKVREYDFSKIILFVKKHFPKEYLREKMGFWNAENSTTKERKGSEFFKTISLHKEKMRNKR